MSLESGVNHISIAPSKLRVPNVSPEYRVSRGIMDLPQFPQFVSDVALLKSGIYQASKNEARTSWELAKARAIKQAEDSVWEANHRIEVLAERAGVVPKGLIPTPEPILPPEPQAPFRTERQHWNNFVLHDFKGVATLPLTISTILDTIKLKSEKAPGLMRMGIETRKQLNLEPNQHEHIGVVDRYMHFFKDNIGNVIRKDRKRIKLYAQLFKDSVKAGKIWDMTVHSTYLLHAVREDNYHEISKQLIELKKTKVAVADIFYVASKSKTKINCDPPDLIRRRIDGVQGIILFNLIKNADVYKKSYIKVYFRDGNIVVENDSAHPIDKSQLYQPMKAGEKQGHTGFGLFSAKKIFGALAGIDLECETSDSSTKETPGTQTVRFIIRRLQPIGSGFHPHQSVQ